MPPKGAQADRSLGDRVGPTYFRLGAGALWTYVCALIPFDRLVRAIPSGRIAVAVFVAGCAVIVSGRSMRYLRAWLSPTRMLKLGMGSLTLVVMLLAADLAFAMRDNWLRSSSEQSVAPDARLRDSTVSHGELYPRTYRPAGETFFLYKPNVRLTGETFGERYVPAMLASPTLTRSVLERRHLSYFIGPEGLRELEPLSKSRIFALGDSFVFGFATDEGKIWPDLLGASLGEPVYNLGISATGPKPQLDLLKYMFKTHSASMNVRHLIWMIFEGNDLENSYGGASTVDSRSNPPALFRGTIVEPFVSLPGRVRASSIAARIARGDVSLSAHNARHGQYRVDGVDLPFPLFRSKRFGDRFFLQEETDRAASPREYVLMHPHRPLLDQTFAAMRDLSREKGFAITVVVAPSDARLYGSAFDGFPILSSEPHFINYVVSLSAEMGFSVVNLLPLLRPFAKEELLYYRDDHHWNERGNEVVAQLLASALAQR